MQHSGGGTNLSCCRCCSARSIAAVVALNAVAVDANARCIIARVNTLLQTCSMAGGTNLYRCRCSSARSIAAVVALNAVAVDANARCSSRALILCCRHAAQRGWHHPFSLSLLLCSKHRRQNHEMQLQQRATTTRIKENDTKSLNIS